MQNNLQDLAISFLRSNPVSAASILEQQQSQQVIALLNSIPLNDANLIIHNFLPSFAAKVIVDLEIEFAVKLLAKIEPSKITSILKYIEQKNIRQAILQALPLKVRSKCKILMNHANDSVGNWMIHDVPILPVDVKSEVAIKMLKSIKNQHKLNFIYIVNRQNHLCGKLDIPDLLNLPEDALVSSILDNVREYLYIYDDLEKVENHNGWDSEDTLPVVNSSNELVGALRHSDLRKWAGKATVNEQRLEIQEEYLFNNILHIYGNVLMKLYEVIVNIVNKKN